MSRLLAFGLKSVLVVVLCFNVFYSTNEHVLQCDDYTYLASNDFAVSGFRQSIKAFYQDLNAFKFKLDYQAFSYAITGYYNMLSKQRLTNDRYLSIIDFTKPSYEKRFYTIDLIEKKIIYHTYVAHGSHTGMVYAKYFSDRHYSRQSSLGFYVTGRTYVGSKGFSLKLHGDETSYNKNMYDRAIVIHSADYVSASVARNQGRLGRSWGCPVLPETVYKPIINTIKNGSLIFAYYNDRTYLNSSKYLNINKAVTMFQSQNQTPFST